jgi:hypothetical protein
MDFDFRQAAAGALAWLVVWVALSVVVGDDSVAEAVTMGSAGAAAFGVVYAAVSMWRAE